MHKPSQGPMPQPRKIPFEFPDDLNPIWKADDPEFCAMVNGASITMPFLEPFLIKTVREATADMDEGYVKDAGRAFNTQEQYHFTAHRRFNELLKAKGYPELALIEQDLKRHYDKLKGQPLRKRMAYTAGFEAMTLGVTKWLVDQRVELFGGSDTRVASFILWHFVEESEHKCVAHDVYQTVFGGSLGAYFARVLGVFHGAGAVAWYSMRGYKAILKKDGRWRNVRSRLRLARRLWGFARYVVPYLLRAALPGHDPRHEKELRWVEEWIAGYSQCPEDQVPLLDTRDPNIPVPFVARAA